MKDILILTLITGLCFVLFMALGIIAIVRKNAKIVIPGLILLLIGGGFGIYTGIIFFYKAQNRLSKIIDWRTGDEIYTALFGEPEYDCLEMIGSQDRVLPKIDFAIYLSFKTCAGEMERITAQKPYEIDTLSKKDFYYPSPSMDGHWFQPSLLGDTIISYNWLKDSVGNYQVIYSNPAMTEAYCKDVWD